MLWPFVSDRDTWTVTESQYGQVPPPSSLKENKTYLLWGWQKDAGVTPQPVFSSAKTDGHISLSIAINSDQTGVITPPHLGGTTGDVVHPLVSADAATSAYGGGAVNIVSDVPTIGPDSVSLNYAQLREGSVQCGPSSNLYIGSVYMQTNASDANEYWGGLWDRSIGSIDLTGKLCALNTAVRFAYSIVGCEKGKKGGLTVGLRSDSSGTVGYRFWTVSAVDSLPHCGVPQTVVFDPANTTRMLSESGTFDISKVDGVFFGLYKSSVLIQTSFTASMMRALSPVIITGGHASYPVTFNSFVEGTYGEQVETITKASPTQFKTKQSLQLGDGVTPVIFTDPNASLAFATPSDIDAGLLDHHADADVNGLTIITTSSCDISLDSVTLSGPSGWPFTIQAGSSTAAQFTGEGFILSGAAPSLQPLNAYAYSGWRFIGCGPIEHNGADLGGSVIDKTTGTYAIEITESTELGLQAALGKLSDVGFTNNDAIALKINYTGSGDLSLIFDAITFSGNTVDIDYNATSASTLTAVMQNGSNASITSVSGSAVAVVISNPVTLTVNVEPSGAEVTLLETGTQTEIDHTETAGNTYTYNYTYSSDIDADLQVYKAGYKPFWLDSVTLGNTSQTITVNLVADAGSQL